MHWITERMVEKAHYETLVEYHNLHCTRFLANWHIITLLQPFMNMNLLTFYMAQLVINITVTLHIHLSFSLLLITTLKLGLCFKSTILTSLNFDFLFR